MRLAALLLLLVVSARAQFRVNQEAIEFYGQVYDAKTKEPIPEAVFHFRSEYSDKKVKTDADGYFRLDVSGAEELRSFLLLFSHPDYREKDFSATLNDYVDGKTKIKLTASSADVKNKRYKFLISCGESGQGITRSGLKSLFKFGCQKSDLSAEGKTELEMILQSGNSIKFIGSGSAEIEIESGTTQVRYAQKQTPKIEIQAYLFPR
ncbi:MAG: hypothetical protein RMM17_12650 [Acidobacteriota bacterium]|nr:hypothetical protein [Blastocatellia bacterium]MDW8413520.1 hypothetical protein [Acidobacteriota bacterium]